MNKIRILGIAPYEAIQHLMLQIARQREDVELEVYIGDMEAGAEIVSRIGNQNFDAVISRGGTAELIRSLTALPVVDIPLSVYDIFRSIKLAENYTSKYALVGFPAITKNAHFLCDMMQYKIDIYTIHNEQEAENTLIRLQKTGCSMILCDRITYSLASSHGLTSILIASGAESVEAAFDSAVQMARSNERLRSEIAFRNLLLENHPWALVVFDRTEKPVFYSRLSELSEPVMKAMKENLAPVLAQGRKTVYMEYNGLLYVLYGSCKVFGGQTLVIYYINHRKVPLALTKNGISYINREQAYDSFHNSFFGITHSAIPQGMSIEQYAQSDVPLVIVGEAGTGKEALARLIYAKSRLQTRPMAIIDCARITDKGWTFLTEHNSSPLSDTNTTIYIQNISALNDARFAEILNIITDLNLTGKNRVIITFRAAPEGGLTARCRKTLDMLRCLLLQIAPMRSHPEDMPNLVSLYISNLNVKMSCDVIGIEPDGLRQMEAYKWPGNYDQLERVMNELVSSAKGPYILAPEVARVLQRELPQTSCSLSFDIHRTLEEINYDVLCRILSECGGNQSLAAKKLGISRTTMWRLMQKRK